eukprot:gene3749-4007_t
MLTTQCRLDRHVDSTLTVYYPVSVEDKISKEARCFHDPEAYDSPDHHRWMCKQDCVTQLHQAYDQLPEGPRKGSPFTCIMFNWQLCEGAAKCLEDWGDLIFTDHTTKKFVVVEVDTFASMPPRQLQQHAERRGQQLFGLLTYLGYSPDWVRCTTFRDELRVPATLPEGLLDLESKGGAAAGFTQIDASTFKPCLLASMLDKFDTILDRDQKVKKCITEYRYRDQARVRTHNGSTVQQQL